MKRRAWVLGLGILASNTLVAMGGLSAVASGQDAVLPQETNLPRVLRFGITDSQIDMRSLTRDDLRPVPAPQIGGLSDQVRFSVVDGDPTCLPGRSTWAGPASATGGLPGVGRPR